MLKKLNAIFKEIGIVVGFLYLADRCLTKISPNLRILCHAFMVQPIPNKPLLPNNLTRSFECHEIKRGDPNLTLMHPPPEIIESRFNQKATCLGVFKNNTFIGYIWFSFSEYIEDESRCKYILNPENSSVFDFDFYIFPEHRLGLAFMVIWNEANRFLSDRGIHQTFSRLTQSNIASKKAHAHLGWKRAGQAIYLKAWHLEIMLATIRPFVGFSLRESGRINIDLNTKT
mgnify:CR=1 FL=1